MTSGIGLSEILLILALTIVFVEPKKIPDLMKKIFKTAAKLRDAVRKITDEFR